MRAPSPPRTVRQLRASPHNRLLLGHACPGLPGGWQRYVDLQSAPEEVCDRTIAELWADGRWTCGRCGGRPAAMVYDFQEGAMRQVERWADDEPPGR